jgi:hypothetical protein
VTGTPVTSANGVIAGTLVTATATCAAGKVALGGGGRITVSSGLVEASVSMRSSYPSAAGTWTVVAVVNAALLAGTSTTVTPYVLCSL